MHDLTQLLNQIEQGDSEAPEQLLLVVYDELRILAAAKMRAERLNHTLQGTALVHEAYFRLVQSPEQQAWSSRGHFFAAAAEAMRRILVDHARHYLCQDRSQAERVVPEAISGNDAALTLDDMLDFNEALVLFEASSPQAAELVKLREAADFLGVPVRSAYRDWSFAQAWLFRQLNPDGA
jgi:RNA polymerase sigma factor (TIGR02999 family)